MAGRTEKLTTEAIAGLAQSSEGLALLADVLAIEARVEAAKLDHEIRTVAGQLVAVRGRKTKAAFAVRLARDAARIGCEPDALLAAVREIAAERADARRREAGNWEARLAAETRLAEEVEQAVAALLAAGWTRTYLSESGSQYFERDGQTLRLADHDVPQSVERAYAAEDRSYQPRWTHEIFVGTRGWQRAVEELTAGDRPA